MMTYRFIDVNRGAVVPGSALGCGPEVVGVSPRCDDWRNVVCRFTRLRGRAPAKKGKTNIVRSGGIGETRRGPRRARYLQRKDEGRQR